MSFIKKTVVKIAIFFYKTLFLLLSTKKNIILFESGNGRNYAGNPRYIYEYFINQPKYEKFKYIWSVEDKSLNIPANPIKVKKNSLKYFYYSIVSNFWIFDSRHPYYLQKKKECVYIQTWHGTPLKKLALDMDKLNMGGKTNIEEYKTNFKLNSSMWDYLIVQNNFSANIFKRAFDFKGTFLKTGYPRNDILFNKKNDDELACEIKKKLKIAKNKKIVLYAPTWRDNEFYSENIYKFSSEMDFDLIKESLSNEYFFIVKYHYLVKDNINWSKYSDFIIVADEKQDIQELYLITDILITDYSSVMFDYSLLKRPIIFYTYDLKFYKEKLRGFYFDLVKEAPGPIIETNQDLIKYLKNFNQEKYCVEHKEKYSEFMDKYNQYDDGNASKKIFELIIKKNK